MVRPAQGDFLYVPGPGPVTRRVDNGFTGGGDVGFANLTASRSDARMM